MLHMFCIIHGKQTLSEWNNSLQMRLNCWIMTSGRKLCAVTIIIWYSWSKRLDISVVIAVYVMIRSCIMFLDISYQEWWFMNTVLVGWMFSGELKIAVGTNFYLRTSERWNVKFSLWSSQWTTAWVNVISKCHGIFAESLKRQGDRKYFE